MGHVSVWAWIRDCVELCVVRTRALSFFLPAWRLNSAVYCIAEVENGRQRTARLEEQVRNRDLQPLSM
jgi:hypothetical protein